MERKDIKIGSGILAGITVASPLTACVDTNAPEIQELPEEVDSPEEETGFVVDNDTTSEMSIIQEEESITEEMNRDATLEEAEEVLEQNELAHTAYWEVETPEDRKPEISEMDIIAGHTDMNEDGYATMYIMTDKGRTQDELLGTYFNGYLGELTEENIDQIVSEVEESVRANVANFKIGEIIVVDEPEVETDIEEAKVTHLEYWTMGSEETPDLNQFDIISCHGDPDEDGNARVTFLVRGTEPITEDKLVDKYFNGFEGEFSEDVKDQIKTDLEEGIRPHVPGFNLTEVVVIYLP
jgi:hypothetical protein